MSNLKKRRRDRSPSPPEDKQGNFGEILRRLERRLDKIEYQQKRRRTRSPSPESSEVLSSISSSDNEYEDEEAEDLQQAQDNCKYYRLINRDGKIKIISRIMFF